MKGKRFFPLALLLALALALAQDGKTLYGQYCAACHGAEAQGIPGAIPPLAGNPRAQDEAYVVKVVREGLSGPLEVNGVSYSGVMPPMPQVSEAEAQAIAQYLNPSCYPAIFWVRRLMLWARTKVRTLMTKPSWVTAWMRLGKR